MKGQLGKHIQNSINIKRARAKHNPKIRKMLEETCVFLESCKNVKTADKFVTDQLIKWGEYCDKFNRFAPEYDAFLINLVKFYGVDGNKPM